MEETEEYDPWGGTDIDSATGKAFQETLKDLAHVYGDRWPRMAAAVIAGTIRDPIAVREMRDHLTSMLGLNDDDTK